MFYKLILSESRWENAGWHWHLQRLTEPDVEFRRDLCEYSGFQREIRLAIKAAYKLVGPKQIVYTYLDRKHAYN